MNVYQVIMAAADHIERSPEEFSYSSCQIPSGPGCGSPGCLVGWIAFFSKKMDLSSFTLSRVCRDILGIKSWGGRFATEYGQFEDRMDRIHQHWRKHAYAHGALREYARMYHAPAPQTAEAFLCNLKASIVLPVNEEAKSEELSW